MMTCLNNKQEQLDHSYGLTQQLDKGYDDDTL